VHLLPFFSPFAIKEKESVMPYFENAEAKYRDLRERLQRGELLSLPKFEELVGELATQDANGTWWEIHPYAARWMYYDGAQWVEGIPPGHEDSTVMPALSAVPDSPSLSSPTNAPIAPTEHRTASREARSQRNVHLPLRDIARRVPLGSNRTWIPFAAGAVILLMCACLIFFGGNLALGVTSPTPLPTQTAVVRRITPLAQPTITLQPTPVVPTATPTPVRAQVIEARVNVRAAPSRDGKIIGKVTKDQEFTVVGRSADSEWFQVELEGIAQPSWVFAQTVEVVSGTVTSLPVAP
jgi:hypothetical protein